MKAHNLINVDPCIIFGSISRINRDEVGRLGKPIHSNPCKIILPLGSSNPTTKSMLIASHFQVGTSRFKMLNINLSAMGTLSN